LLGWMICIGVWLEKNLWRNEKEVGRNISEIK
jgi:hypothetical protein